MTHRDPKPGHYGGLIPNRVAALGVPNDPEPRLPGLQHAVYRLIVWLGDPGRSREKPVNLRLEVVNRKMIL